MNYEIKQEEKRTVAGFHLVGPWEQTVKKGFEQLMMWVDSKNIVPKEWVAVYYDNPDETPAEKLRCDTVVTVPGYFTLPENSEWRHSDRNYRWSVCGGGSSCSR